MMNIMKINVEKLTAEVFAPYGEVIEFASTAPDFSGDGWNCWFPVNLIKYNQAMGIGITESLKRAPIISKMERHVDNVELLMPIKDQLIQPMGLPKDLDNPAALPDPATVKAFLLEPGQAIIMKKGAWHDAAHTLSDSSIYYFFSEKSDQVYPWVPFKDNLKIRFEL